MKNLWARNPVSSTIPSPFSCRLGGAIAQPNIFEQNPTILLGFATLHPTYEWLRMAFFLFGEGIVQETGFLKYHERSTACYSFWTARSTSPRYGIIVPATIVFREVHLNARRKPTRRTGVSPVPDV